MALGNNSGKGTARHKGQIRQSIKEHRNARGFYSLSGSTVESGNAAACALGSTPNTYYHSGSSAAGYTTNDYVYTIKRQNSRFYLPDGYYKVSHDGSTFKSIQISSGQIASTPSTCR